jgi:protein disulfide-isomerase-like protein
MYIKAVVYIKMFKKLLILTMAIASNAVELTPDNWDEMTAGKTVFVKFFAPWCGHCKKMKPAWDSLMAEYESHETILVADVDCINAGKDLCSQNGVKGFPTVKWGSADALEDYKGGRDSSALKNFASELGPQCDVGTLENCSEDQVELVKQLKEQTVEVLLETVKTYNTDKDAIETAFKEQVAQLQKTYTQMSEMKDMELEILNNNVNVGLINSVISHKQSNTQTEL